MVELRRRPSVLANVGLALATLALIGLAAEGAARWAWHRAASRPAPELPEEWRDLPRLTGMHAMARPNVRGIVGGVLYETNSAGFRGPERALEKAPGVFRVVVIGDSIAMGTGVLYEETYAARLESALASRFPDRTVEVLDMGLAGLNAPSIVKRFERRSLSYAPDLVIYGYTLNDIEGKKYRRSADAGFTGPLASWQSPVYVWRYLKPRLNSLRELLGPPRGSYSFELDENYLRNPEAWQEVLEALDRLAELVRQRELCAVMLVHTKLYSLGWLHPFRRHYDLVAEAARERGFHVIQSWPSFEGRASAELRINAIDSHPNAEGHALLFEALRDGLANLPDACWERRHAP
jgi:lysophospholipase L1-like esterase